MYTKFKGGISMNMKFYLRIVSFLGFITSGVFTYLAYVPTDIDNTERVIAIAMTVVCQLGSFLFLQLSLLKNKKANKSFYFILAILLFSLSIVATISYQSQRQSTISNTNIVKSERYKESVRKNEIEQKKFSQLESDIATTKQAIAKLSQDNKQVIDAIIADMNNPKTPQWRKEQVGLTLKKTQETQADIIKQKNELLADLNTKYQNFTFTEIDNSITSIENKTFEQNLATIFNVSENKVRMIMQVFFAIVFELTAIGSHIALKQYDNTKDFFDKFKGGTKQAIAKLPKVTMPQPTINIPVPVPAPAINKVSLIKPQDKPQPINISKIDNSAIVVEKNDRKFNRQQLKAYIKTMHENSKNNLSIGYKKLGKLADLNEGIAKEIHKYLQEKKIVEVINGRTKILIND